MASPCPQACTMPCASSWGQAAGHNWFCVLFPPLCVPAAADADDGPAYPQEEEEAVRTPYKVKFAALEWWQRLWGGA